MISHVFERLFRAAFPPARWRSRRPLQQTPSKPSPRSRSARRARSGESAAARRCSRASAADIDARARAAADACRRGERGPQDPTAYKVTSSSTALKTDTPILRTR